VSETWKADKFHVKIKVKKMNLADSKKSGKLVLQTGIILFLLGLIALSYISLSGCGKNANGLSVTFQIDCGSLEFLQPSILILTFLGIILVLIGFWLRYK